MSLLTTPAPAPQAVTPSRVLVLQSMTAYPSVSLLLSTEPASALDRADVARLHSMRDDVARRLEAEGYFSATRLVGKLDDLIELAQTVEIQRGLALFASEAFEQLLVLPVSVRERAVVDPTFATRDLVRALHRTPRHVILVLSAKEARLFEGEGGRVTPVVGAKFPRTAESPLPRREGPERFLAEVDDALGAYLRLHPAPLFVIGAEPTLSRFCQRSRNTGRLAGKVAGNYLNAPLAQLAQLVNPAIETYLLSRQDEALGLLERRVGQDRAVMGIDAVWLAARWERPEMLAVEVDFFYPASLSEDGDRLLATDDVERPDVIDDAVDEVIERVLDRGGWVALVESGLIPDGARIAMTIKGT